MAVRGIITSFHETVVESDCVVATRGSFVRSHRSDAPHDPLLRVLNCNRSCLVQFTELRDEDDKVKVGDPVVTSYVSDQYQEGILIG